MRNEIELCKTFGDEWSQLPIKIYTIRGENQAVFAQNKIK